MLTCLLLAYRIRLIIHHPLTPRPFSNSVFSLQFDLDLDGAFNHTSHGSNDPKD